MLKAYRIYYGTTYQLSRYKAFSRIGLPQSYTHTTAHQPIQQINRNINKVISSNSLLHSSSNYCTKYVQQTALSPLNTRRVDVVTSQLIRITPIASISSSNSNGGIVDGLAWGLVGLLEAQQSLLISLHEAISFAGTACPWWATLMIGTVVVRTLFTLPIAIAQQRSTARLLGLQPMLKAWQETLARQLGREARDQRWHFAYYEQQLQRRFRRKVNEIYWQQRCHPAMGIAAMMIQIPLFISMSLAVRRLCHQPIPWLEAYFNNSDSNDRVATVALEMAQPEAGLLWWTDLTAIDSTLVLPVVIGLVHLANVELNANGARNSSPTVWQQRIRYVLRGVSIATVPIASQLPTAICIYWCTSAVYSLLQNIAFQRPTIQTWFGFPSKSRPS